MTTACLASVFFYVEGTIFFRHSLSFGSTLPPPDFLELKNDEFYQDQVTLSRVVGDSAAQWIWD
jgi:hypothetical protein